ncbi:hypothetical protein I602_1252 [Polaribacter dokdonensis DSW-5]|uniref:Uncharacterized protein n=1 Tax=Polaribacter dokdonensis DSW-5 TaxID=1300348 RepID=A0A0M9CFV4_9FLAO|nr:hypothetical protein I602_1252 [Polaribacter dokdonensis DSW-5]
MTSKGGSDCFYISLADLKAETCFSEKVITKNIKILVEAGLVISIRPGLGRPNLYSVNHDLVDAYVIKFSAEFGKWQTKVRESSKGFGVKESSPNSPSVPAYKVFQEVSKEDTTNNKITNNKNTNNLTNRASSEREFELEELFESLIEKFRYSEEELKNEDLNSIFELLVKLVPEFQYFKMSESDKDLIIQMIESEIESDSLFFKLYQNAEHIQKNEKEARFGNLFVGIPNMIDNFNNAVL